MKKPDSRRKKQLKRQQQKKVRRYKRKSQQGGRPAINAHTEEGTTFFSQYYQIAFQYLYNNYSNDIREALLQRPPDLTRSYWALTPKQSLFVGTEAWEKLRNQLAVYETEMARIIAPHSVYFWLHLYRRIGVSLHPGHRSKTDANTVGLVRTMLEVAFFKWGSLRRGDDLVLSNLVSNADAMGGLFQEAGQLLTPDDKALLHYDWDIVKRNPQLVLHDFGPQDFVNIYYLEGLAYEYWVATAQLRAVGKGDAILISENGLPTHAPGDIDLDRLIESYDERIFKHVFGSSNAGIGFFQKKLDSTGVAVVLAHNIERTGWDKLPFLGDVIATGHPNFTVALIDLSAFISAHSFMEEDFKKAKGFSISSLVRFLGLVHHASWVAMIKDKRYAVQMMQRAYSLSEKPMAEISSEVLELSEELGEMFEVGLHKDLKVELSAVVEFLTLSDRNQSSVCVWSYGPRFLFVPFGNAWLIDYSALPHVLYGLFFRVGFDQAKKGSIFEEKFREAAGAAGIEVLPTRKVVNHLGEQREIDAALRVGNALFVCECRAMARPFDYEIGNIKTIGARIADLDGKLDQASSLRDFLNEHRKGRNYDFSWAEAIEHFVISPYVEWIWSLDSKYWYSHGLPRIVSGQELIDFLTENERTD